MLAIVYYDCPADHECFFSWFVHLMCHEVTCGRSVRMVSVCTKGTF